MPEGTGLTSATIEPFGLIHGGPTTELLRSEEEGPVSGGNVKLFVIIATPLLILVFTCFAAAESGSHQELGVVATRAGFMHGSEVVELLFNCVALRWRCLVPAA